MNFRITKALAASAAIAMIFALPARGVEKPDIATLSPAAIDVKAAKIGAFSRTSGDTWFGQLEFLSGLVLTAPASPNFGGWSGLVLDADAKRFVAVSDSGVWMTGAFAYDGAALAGVTDARLGPLLARDGKPLKRRGDRDAEAVALISGSPVGGQLYVSFEQNARVARYDVTPAGLSASQGVLEKPALMRKMSRNTGLEAMTVLRGGPNKGATIAMAERYLDSARNHTGWIWTAGGAQAFHMTNVGDFDVTDVAGLEDGTLFVLERRFRWLEGVKMRIRRLAPGDVEPGKTAEGDVLIEADLEQQIDNMEGLAATRTKSGDVVLTVISDDNFNSFLQRSIVLQFKLLAGKTVKARSAD